MSFMITGGCLLQMYDLYSRERIDTKADVWVSPVILCNLEGVCFDQMQHRNVLASLPLK